MSKITKTLSDFCAMPIVRQDDIATVVFDHDTDDHPVRLLGFYTEASKSDFEIAEEAYRYYQKLMASVNRLTGGK